MGVNIEPLADYVVAVGEEASAKTASGIYLPDNAQEKPKTAKIVAVGKKAEKLLDEMGIPAAGCVRRPANGGATAFRAGLESLLDQN